MADVDDKLFGRYYLAPFDAEFRCEELADVVLKAIEYIVEEGGGGRRREERWEQSRWCRMLRVASGGDGRGAGERRCPFVIAYSFAANNSSSNCNSSGLFAITSPEELQVLTGLSAVPEAMEVQETDGGRREFRICHVGLQEEKRIRDWAEEYEWICVLFKGIRRTAVLVTALKEEADTDTSSSE
ncbi:hypothetical protein PG997_001836 [Apiospora hydei]|uniref:Uncharacterized protein n=1 Tax=Apiospora hydei TaxID=1337664 RepID=A0ABR1X7X8_9PEZI